MSISMAMTIKITIFWNGTPYSPVKIYQHFGETCYLHFQSHSPEVQKKCDEVQSTTTDMNM
jgi:hypothetical protein